ncbi:hypothetical protein MEBOL_002858 [Melittangium boletus DSM 14713]|uniref:Uncharacterized protein n=2 Tax=Melittangium boletus TaxID=83453 RepID=A0A250IC38_9BACT|nr:hypothetical protein MEBOL_002858 [Melittangium boletus DSM 14713]
MREVPHGSTQVLVPRVEDADWLNINRPLFAQRELRVVLFCDTETSIALAQRAVDFFDWISHRVECPKQPPRFSVSGIRTALAVQAPGIIWTGGDLQAAFAAARPRGHLHQVSAALPYPKMVEELRRHQREWIAWTDVNSTFRLRRVRWAHAETGHRTRAILVEPAVPSPGWWSLHGRMADVREARARLEHSGVSFPGRVAALHDFRPEILAKLESRDTRAHVEDPTEQEGASILRVGALLFFERVPNHAWLRELCLQAFLNLEKRSAKAEQLSLDDRLTWTAWSASFSRFKKERTISFNVFDQLNPAYSVELILPRMMHMQDKWAALTLQATLLHDLDAAEHWSRRLKPEDGSGSPIILALVRSMKGKPEEAELLLRAQLRTNAHPGIGPTERPALLTSLGSVLDQQGKHHEAEDLIREELVRLEQLQAPNISSKNRLLHQLSSALRKQGKYSEAEKTILQAITTHPDQSNEDRADLGRRLNELARILNAMGKDEAAESAFQQALTLLGSTLGTGHISYTTALTELFSLLESHGRQGESEPLLRRAIYASQTSQDEENPNHAKLLRLLAAILSDQGQYAEAEKLLKQALHINNTFSLDDPAMNWMIVHQLAVAIQFQGRYDEAERLFRQAISIIEQGHGMHDLLHRASLLSLGGCLLRQGRDVEAEPFLARALEILKNTQQQADVSTIEEFNNLSIIQSETGNDQAQATAREALNLIAATPGLAQSTPQELIDSLAAIAQVPTDLRNA